MDIEDFKKDSEMTKEERQVMLMQTQPIKITIEFTAYISAAQIPKEDQRLMAFFDKGKLTSEDLEDIVPLNRDYFISELSSDMRKGITVNIIG